MKFPEARRLADAAFGKATELGKDVAVVVVDSGGWIVLAERRNEREPFATYSAECKAVTSALIGRDSKDLTGTMERYPFLAAPLFDRLSSRFIAMGGGALLKRDDEIIGGIGIAGSGAESDHEIAKAAAAIFE